VVRRLEQTALVDHRSGERALHVTKELGLEHALRERAAIDRHEWSVGSRARGMDGPRDELLPGSGLSLDITRASDGHTR
jgi:hypothetical protein